MGCLAAVSGGSSVELGVGRRAGWSTRRLARGGCDGLLLAGEAGRSAVEDDGGRCWTAWVAVVGEMGSVAGARGCSWASIRAAGRTVLLARADGRRR
ncbi:hypothetical protein ACLOJK_017224 [Asimina triloba]